MAFSGLRVDEQSTYIDVYCDGFITRVYKDEQAAASTLLQIRNPANSASWGRIAPYISVSSTDYAIRSDGERSTTIIENTPNRVQILVKGNFEDMAGETELSNSYLAQFLFTIYPDRITTAFSWVTIGTITLDNDDFNRVSGATIDIYGLGLSNANGVYENSGAESDAVNNTDYNSAKYFAMTTDEVNFQMMSLFTVFDLGTASYRQHAESADQDLYITINNGTVNAGTHVHVFVLVVDSASRQGSAQIYNSTDRLAMGRQYTDLEIRKAGGAGGSRVFLDASTQYLKRSEAVRTAYPMTVSLFFKTDADDDYYNLWSMGDTNGDEHISIVLRETGYKTAQLHVRHSGAAVTAECSNTYTVGQWQHVCAVLTSDTLREIILNGNITNKGTSTASKTFPSNLDNTHISGFEFNSNPIYDCLDGKEAHVAVWNVALTDAEVAELAAGANPKTIRPESLVAYWPLVDDDEDAVGGYDMTPYNSPTWSTTDFPDAVVAVGGSRVFDNASSQYLKWEGTPPITGAPFTIAGWAKTDDLTIGQYLLALADKDVENERLGINLGGNRAGDPAVFFKQSSGDTDVEPETTNTISANTWHHVVGISAASNDHRVILDGDWANSGTSSTTNEPVNLDRIVIGVSGDSSLADYMSGNLAHVAIWNVALTALEVARLANGALPTEIRPEALVAYWPLVDDDNDPIGGYDMTPYNSPTWSTTDFPEVWMPDVGMWEIQNMIVISESGFQADGAWHIISQTPYGYLKKPPTDNDDLKTAPDVDASGGIAYGLKASWLFNEKTGTNVYAHQDSNYNGVFVDENSDGYPRWCKEGIENVSSTDYNRYINVTSNPQTPSAFTVITKVRFANDGHHKMISRHAYHATGGPYGWTFTRISTNDYFRLEFSVNGTTWVNASGPNNSCPINEWMTLACTFTSGSQIVYKNGVAVGSNTISGTVYNHVDQQFMLLFSGYQLGGNIEEEAFYGKMEYIYFWDRVLSPEEIRFVTNNPYWMFGDGGNAKVTIDRTRIRPATVIEEWPFQIGPVDNPVDTLLNFLKMDDNAANNTLKAEVGPDGTWHAVSDDSARNTSLDSVSGLNFRGRALDTQDGTGYGKFAVGSGTVHNNAFLQKGSVLIKITPQFVYNDAANQTIWKLRYDADNEIVLYYSQSTDKFSVYARLGASNQSILNVNAFTENYSLQSPRIFLVSWDFSKDFVLHAQNGKVIGFVVHTGTPTSSEPTIFYIGAEQSQAYPGDLIIDEVKTFSECILPFGAFYIGNGEGLLADIDNPHSDLCFFWDAQGLPAKGGSNLATDKTGTLGSSNTGGTTSFPTSGGIVGGYFDNESTSSNYGIKFAVSSFDIFDPEKGALGMWIYINSLANWDRFLSFWDFGNDCYFDFGLNGSQYYWAQFTSTGGTDALENTLAFAPTTAKWTWLTLQWDIANDRLDIGINGVKYIGTDTTTETWDGSTSGDLYLLNNPNMDASLDAYIGRIFISKNPDTPQLWTAFGKPRHIPRIDLT